MPQPTSRRKSRAADHGIWSRAVTGRERSSKGREMARSSPVGGAAVETVLGKAQADGDAMLPV